MMDSDRGSTHRCRGCQSKAKSSRVRRLHQSTLNLGDAASSYTTTHTQSYCGRSADGRPLVFHLRDPSFPSQHRTRLDLSEAPSRLQSPLLSHTRQVYRPQHVAQRSDPTLENWTRYRSGQAVRELTAPQDPTEYRTTYQSQHTLQETRGSTRLAGGRATQWHQHNIVTGEQAAAPGPGPGPGPGQPSRRSRDKLLWAARRRETDCSALRLY